MAAACWTVAGIILLLSLIMTLAICSTYRRANARRHQPENTRAILASTSSSNQPAILVPSNHPAKDGVPAWQARVLRSYYINLARRPDRRAQMEGVLASLDLPTAEVERIEAVATEIGETGCHASHRLMVEKAIVWSDQYPTEQVAHQYVALFEDDFCLAVPAETFNRRVSDLLAALAGADVILLGMGAETIDAEEPGLAAGQVRVYKSFLCHGKLVRIDYLPILFGSLLLGEHETLRSWADGRWYKSLQRLGRWYGLWPAVSKQQPGLSDLAHAFRDYTCYEESGGMLRHDSAEVVACRLRSSTQLQPVII